MQTDRLCDSYAALLLDLDGTLYRGAEPVAGAVDALQGLEQRLLYVTNNASRSPAEVADHLTKLGFSASTDDVVTSAQAAANVLAARVPAGAAVVVVGTEALADEVRAVGLRPIRRFDGEAAAAVQGHSVETAWGDLAEAVYAIRAGALWVAANTDTTLPTERGLAPGNGSMVAAVRAATGQEPTVAGKPAAPLLDDALRRADTRSALVVGDRLDTDIAGANEVGLPSLLVLTGVSTADDLLRAVADERPTYVAYSLDSLNRTVELERVEHDWRIVREGTELILTGSGDSLQALACATSAAWSYPEFTGVRGGDEDASAAIDAWTDEAARENRHAVPLQAAVGPID